MHTTENNTEIIVPGETVMEDPTETLEQEEPSDVSSKKTKKREYTPRVTSTSLMKELREIVKELVDSDKTSEWMQTIQEALTSIMVVLGENTLTLQMQQGIQEQIVEQQEKLGEIALVGPVKTVGSLPTQPRTDLQTNTQISCNQVKKMFGQ